MSTETINNLTEQLNWLLRAKPFAPPPAPTISVASATSSASDHAVASVSDSAVQAANLSGVTVRSPRRSRVQPEEGDMARLRAGPTTSASKSRLLSHGSHDDTESRSRVLAFAVTAQWLTKQQQYTIRPRQDILHAHQLRDPALLQLHVAWPLY
jgi:hypothetical protein